MSKRETTLVLDEQLLRDAERIAHARQTTLNEVLEAAIRREVRSGGSPPRGGEVRLPTHGSGGLLPGVDLEDKELMDRLLTQ